MHTRKRYAQFSIVSEGNKKLKIIIICQLLSLTTVYKLEYTTVLSVLRLRNTEKDDDMSKLLLRARRRLLLLSNY